MQKYLVCVVLTALCIILLPITYAQSITSSDDKKISLDFQNIPTYAVLQSIAKFAGKDVIVSDSVRGNLTMQLQNMTYPEALDIILKTRGLTKREIGKVWMIAPTEEVARHEQQELKYQQQMSEMGALKAELIHLRYGRADDIATTLKDKNNNLLSSRGAVSVDARTNSLWLQDVPAKLEEIRRLVTQLDIPMQQVLIEARVVNIDEEYERDLGVKFGLTRPGHASGTLAGANALANKIAPANIPIRDRLNVDLAAMPLSGDPVHMGIALMKLADGILLDLELSALESAGQAEIISCPRLITASQQAAVIQAGQEIPYQESTSSGATNVAFKKAVLSLSVVPQITPDKKILLQLKINQDKASPKLINNVPAIDTREIETQVMVSNGQTVVLGGIYEEVNDKQVERVPFLSNLPWVGALFQKKHTNTSHRELLIFVTPKIIEQV